MKIKNKLFQNISMLYIMNIAKLIFPMLTLPYLTRVLSLEAYGVTTYVKACMQYAQLIIDFAFNLSVAKAIIDAAENSEKEKIIGQTVLAKLLLAFGAFVVIFIMSLTIPMLRENLLFTLLSFAAIALTAFLVDFYFSAIEQMQVITLRFVAAKMISTIFTFVFVKNDGDLMWIPILDIIGNLAAVALTWIEVNKNGFHLKFGKLSESIKIIKESSVYFISNMATTAFGALNTLLVGIFCTKADVAYWGVAMQLIGAIQSMYAPIINGVYPRMLKERSMKIIKQMLKIFMPIVIVGCIICVFGAKLIMVIVGGKEYAAAANVFKCLVPVLLFSFPAMLYGWPVLGIIGKVKENSITTVITAVLQIAGLVILLLVNKFTLINIALLRGITELILFAQRFMIYILSQKNEEI